MELIDVTEKMTAALREADVRDLTAGLQPSQSPQAALMFAKMAAHRADKISGWDGTMVDEIDMNLLFQALAACLSSHIDQSIEPSSEEPRAPDDDVAHFFACEIMNAINRHQHAATMQGLRSMFYDPVADILHIGLLRRRHSALLGLDSTAQFDLLDHTTSGLLRASDGLSDPIIFAFASNQEYLHFIQSASAKSWDAFCEAAGFSASELTAFSAFIAFLEFAAEFVGHSLLYSESFLLRLLGIFREAYPDASLSDEAALRMLRLFALSPEEALAFRIVAPFIVVKTGYLRFHRYTRCSPALGLLSIAIRKNQDAWSRTVGGTLAFAADALADTLPSFERCLVVTRRRLGDKGDVDLALFDVVTNEMLICEIKTVYDRHRTTSEFPRFESDRVNLPKAIGQLRLAMSEVLSDAAASRLFNRPLPAPSRVSAALLHLADPVDLTCGTEDHDILSTNFAIFRYLFGLTGGDVALLVRVISELRSVWFVAKRVPIDLAQPEAKADLEVQTSVIDSHADLGPIGLSDETRRLLEMFPRLPDDWRSSLEDAPLLVSYVGDSRKALGQG